MSQALSTVVGRLQGDWDFIAGFLDNPEQALTGFELSAEEHKALTARDQRSLMRLGLEQDAVTAALSGSHSSRCPTFP